jgi:hypothetical protein
VFYPKHWNPTGETMVDVLPVLSLVYLTIPAASEPVLHLKLGEQYVHFRVTRDQLLDLNADIADALIRGRQRRLPDGQLNFPLDPHPAKH